MKQKIEDKITTLCQPVRLEVVDDSARHQGHSGARVGGESHFNVTVISDYFVGMSRIKRQQAIYHVLDEEFASGLHALSLTLRTREEDGLR